MAANLTQIPNFKANFHQECELFSKINSQALEMNSCALNEGCNLGCLIGYHSLTMDVLGMNGG